MHATNCEIRIFKKISFLRANNGMHKYAIVALESGAFDDTA